jgi:hypothetical protein
MPQKVLRFTGINKRANVSTSAGACEELINIRPSADGALEIVKQKTHVLHGADYQKFYEHAFGDELIHVIVTSSGNVNWINTKNGRTGQITKFSDGNVEISSAGNVILFYSEKDKLQYAYKFVGNTYERYTVGAKKITDAYVLSDFSSNTAAYTIQAEDESLSSYKAALNKAASAFYSDYPNGLCGAAIIGCTYELEDGSEFWSTAFTVANITRENGYEPPFINSANRKIVVFGTSKARFVLSLSGSVSSNVKKINIYATRPVFPFDIQQAGEGVYEAKSLSLEDLNLEGQLMYYQGSVSPNETGASFLLNFGKEQAGEKVMEVTSGCIERIGNSVSYNNRFHFYRSEVNHVIQIPTISNPDYSSSPWVAYVKFDNSWKLVNHIYYLSESDLQDVIYPMAGIKNITFVKGYVDAEGYIKVDYSDMFTVELKDSTAYNYSYAFGVKPVVKPASSFKDTVTAAGQLYGNGYDNSVLLKNEVNAINVSAQFNPFVFPIKYSYSFGGDIIDVMTSYVPISSTQIGQYPLSVFTTNGIYSLEQGSGSTLYGNIIPIQPHVSSGKATASPYGIFFVASRSLYLLAGRDISNLSVILNGEPELSIRNNSAYTRLYCADDGFYNFSTLLDCMSFEEFISSSSMIYDQFRNELIISSTEDTVPYSYVLNLETKAYHKIAKRYLKNQNGSRYAIEVSDAGSAVVDLYSEDKTDQSILLQSKPLSLDVFYTHIQRLILLVDTVLSTDNQNLSLSVFASDNMNDWKCIISSQKRKTILRQIRTNMAAKSFKDYVIIINGTVGVDSNISDIIADYTVVQRRLG